MVAETTLLRPPVDKSAPIRKLIFRVAVVVAVAWNLYSFRHVLLHLGNFFSWHNICAAFDLLFRRLPVLGALYVIFEVAFCLGAAMMVWGIGQKVHGGGWRKSLKTLRRRVKELVASNSTNQLYRWGLYLNWAGAAMTTGIIPIIFIVWLLPSNRWGGQMALPVEDLISTMVWRIAVRPRKVKVGT